MLRIMMTEIHAIARCNPFLSLHEQQQQKQRCWCTPAAACKIVPPAECTPPPPCRGAIND